MTKRQIEDIVLGMAAIVEECRYLRDENEYLREKNAELREQWKKDSEYIQGLPGYILSLGLGIIDKENSK